MPQNFNKSSLVKKKKKSTRYSNISFITEVALHCSNMPARQHPAGMQTDLSFPLFPRLELIPALDTDRICFRD